MCPESWQVYTKSRPYDAEEQHGQQHARQQGFARQGHQEDPTAIGDFYGSCCNKDSEGNASRSCSKGTLFFI